MGHWEQIGVENQRERERIAALPPGRRLTRSVVPVALWLLVIAGIGWWLVGRASP